MEMRRADNVSPRRRAWPMNAVRAALMRLDRSGRDKNIWVFGCWGGKLYDDSSRYLYEYVSRNYSQIQAYWITCDPNIWKRLSSNGQKVLLAGDKEAKKIMCKAGVAFYTNGLDDFGYDCYLYDAFLVLLPHGMDAIKKAYYVYRPNKVHYFLHRVQYMIFSWYRFDCCAASSAYGRDGTMDSFNDSDYSRHVITGIPRVDVLRDKGGFKVTAPGFVKAGYRYVTIVPTYRLYDNSVIADIIEGFQNDHAFMDFVKKNKIMVLIKPHFADKSFDNSAIKTDNIMLVSANDVGSTQALLYFTDVLVTDYSSICMDFAFTGRPVIMYAPDYKLYNETNGITDRWFGIYQSDKVLKNVSDLTKAVISACNKEKDSYAFTDHLRELYEDPALIDSVFSENVVQETISRIGGIDR